MAIGRRALNDNFAEPSVSRRDLIETLARCLAAIREGWHTRTAGRIVQVCPLEGISVFVGDEFAIKSRITEVLLNIRGSVK